MLTLDVVRDGIIVPEQRVVVAHRDVDDTQPSRYFTDPDTKFEFDLDEWHGRYWNSGDDSTVVRRWKSANAENFYGHRGERGRPGRGLLAIEQALECGLIVGVGFLHLAHLLGDGEVVDYGLISVAVVTDVGCQKIVAVMNASDAVTAVNFKFHALGTGNTAEAAGDTALVTELTTEYTGNVRATGSQTTGATTKVYRSVGTNTLDSGTPAVVEHGILSASSAGSLLDRSVFSAINLTGANGDGIQSTYDLTFTSGG